MTKMMLIDAVHPEEVRVAVVNKGQVEDFDFESAKKRQLRGNIYLAKITRVEPSLQAAFVDFGGNRHGFLAFSEIHPDYYQLPQADREALLAEAASQSSLNDDDDIDEESDDDEGGSRNRSSNYSAQKRYKIQEVVRRRQIMLVQAVKEERGNKGAALTTYLSLAGRYCVLMPNTPRGGGISRKITNAVDRKRLKKIVSELNVPEGMGLIVRTAGAKRTKTELKRDFEYLIRLWSKIRELTLTSVAPCLINEEAGLVQRAIRDLYDKDIDQIIVDGEPAYREAKDLAKMLMPSHSRKVQLQRSGVPVFSEHRVEGQLNSIFSPTVQLRSGGYLVIHQTEALVAIDVNSGKSTRERNIEQTAVRTNLEAAEEACRQMRLRDLAGLIVIDFIDMEESKNNRAVEKRMKDCLRYDRARVQNNKISMFGLMEISRQRRRAGVLDSSSDPCDACAGTGHVRSVDSAALQLLRALENRCAGLESGNVEATAPTDVVLFLLNEKRHSVASLEERHNIRVQISARGDLLNGDFEIRVTDNDGEIVEHVEPKYVPPPRIHIPDDPEDEDEDDEEIEQDEEAAETEKSESKSSSTGRRRRRRRRGGADDPSKSSDNLKILDDPQGSDDDNEENSGPSDFGSSEEDDNSEDSASRKRRRRGRRGGRRRRGRDNDSPIELHDEVDTIDGGAILDEAASNVIALVPEGTEIVAKAEVAEEVPAKTEAVEEAETAGTEAHAAESVVAETVEEPVLSAIETETTDAESETPAIAEVDEPATIIPEEDAPQDKPEPVEPVSTTPSAPQAQPAPEITEDVAPVELPETEKPKTVKRGWWQKRSDS